MSNELLGGNLLSKYWEKEMLRVLMETAEFYRVHPVVDTRPWWKRMWQRVYWSTVGRYRAWLHRDCGEY